MADGLRMAARVRMATCALLAACVLHAGCAGSPPVPDWQLDARDASERAQRAYLSGDPRVEAAEWARARTAVARTGQLGLAARLALMPCAAQVASLVFEDCPGFKALAADAAPAEQAYAAHLAGQATAAQADLLPPAQRGVAAGAAGPQALEAIAEPLSRLVAAGVLMRRGQASPAVVAVAVETASAQGWRRPLLAWLQVQALQFDAAGAREDAERTRRRMALVLQAGAAASAAPPEPAAAPTAR